MRPWRAGGCGGPCVRGRVRAYSVCVGCVGGKLCPPILYGKKHVVPVFYFDKDCCYVCLKLPSFNYSAFAIEDSPDM